METPCLQNREKRISALQIQSYLYEKGRKKATLYICHLVNRSFVSLFNIQVPRLTVCKCCAFSSMTFGAGTGLIHFGHENSTTLADHFFFLVYDQRIILFNCWSTLGQQCQVLSFLLLSICNWHLFLLDCNEFLVETPKWNPHHWYLQARIWQLEDGSSRWTYWYQWKENDKMASIHLCFARKQVGDTQKRGKPEMRSSCRKSLDLHWLASARPGRGPASVPHLRYLSVSRHFNE